MKRIGIFAYDFYPFEGGQGRQLTELYKLLYKSDRFILFTPCINKFKNHITTYNFCKKIGKHILFSVLLNLNINSFVRKYNLGTIHLSCGPGGLILLRKPKVRLICTVHHTYYQQQKYVKGQRWKYLFYLLEKIMFKNADKIIAVSDDTRNVLIKNYQINPNKIAVIPNGVNTKKFHVISGIKKLNHSIIFVGRLEERKGVDFLIKAIPFVKEKIPDVKLYIVGKGKLKNQLLNYVSINNIARNIEILDTVSDQELVKLYNQCQIAVVPSIFEGFGISVLEAIACGLPIIGTSSDGVKSLINIFNNSSLVNYGDIKKLSNLITVRLSQKNAANNEITKILNSDFNWDNIYQKTSLVYKNVK